MKLTPFGSQMLALHKKKKAKALDNRKTATEKCRQLKKTNKQQQPKKPRGTNRERKSKIRNKNQDVSNPTQCQQLCNVL